MPYILQPPTLQHMCLANVATLLWKNDAHLQREITEALPHLYDSGSNKEFRWMRFEDEVSAKTDKIELPDTLRASVRNFVRPIGLEICEWILYLHYHVLCWKNEATKAIRCINHTRWTPNGKINVVESAEALLSLSGLSLKDKYQIACVYCLENDVRDIWRRLEAKQRDFFTNGAIFDDNKLDIVKFWTCTCVCAKSKPAACFDVISWKLAEYNDKTGSDSNKYEYMFRWAVNYNNEAAVRYFWEKLTGRQQNRNLFLSIKDVADHWHARGVMCFLISHMERFDFRMTDVCFFVLECLLSDWLYCEFFTSTFKRVSDHLDHQITLNLLCKAANQVRKFPGGKYGLIFAEFWRDTSSEFKNSCLEHEGDRIKLSSVIQELSESEDLSNVRLLLSDVDVEMRKTILSQCVNLLTTGKWEFFKRMAVELIPADQQMISFKQLCAKKLYIIYTLNFMDETQWRLMDSVLWLFTSQEEIAVYKRKLITGPFIACKLTQDLEINGEKQLVSIDRIFDWLALTNGEIRTFKRDKIANHRKVIDALLHWICEDRWASINAFLNWCFGSKSEIRRFKRQLMYKNDFNVFVKHCINVDDNVYFTCKVLDWCLDGYGAPEVPCECLYYACNCLLAKKKFDSANRFVDRYCTKKGLGGFKAEVFARFGLGLFNHYLLSCHRDRGLVYQYRKPDLDRNEVYSYFGDGKSVNYCFFDGRHIERLVKWFELSQGEIVGLRNLVLMKEEQEFKKDVLMLLDEFCDVI